jgi:hypothetical protein
VRIFGIADQGDGAGAGVDAENGGDDLDVELGGGVLGQDAVR